jgi:hypothetical protein
LPDVEIERMFLDRDDIASFYDTVAMVMDTHIAEFDDDTASTAPFLVQALKPDTTPKE